MKFKIILLLVLLPVNAFSDSVDWARVPFKEGQTIHEVRSVLMRDGWQPFEIECKYLDEGESRIPDWSSAKDFYDAGVVEVGDCAGTGKAYCSFNYRKGEICLTVITAGEEDAEKGYFARVESFNFHCPQQC